MSAENIKHIKVDMPTASLRIVDNNSVPDLCLQHLVALMIADRGASFASVHDVARIHPRAPRPKAMPSR